MLDAFGYVAHDKYCSGTYHHWLFLRRGTGQEYFISNRYFSGGPQRRFAAAICFKPERNLKLPRNGRCLVQPLRSQPLHKRDNEPHCDQGVQAGDG